MASIQCPHCASRISWDERTTTDNAAAASTQPTEEASPELERRQSAALTQTPLMDAFCKRFEIDMSMPEDSIEKFARRLEALCHQQQEAIDGLRMADKLQSPWKEALAAYAALEKEMEL